MVFAANLDRSSVEEMFVASRGATLSQMQIAEFILKAALSAKLFSWS
jgi:hypothetical protein